MKKQNLIQFLFLIVLSAFSACQPIVEQENASQSINSGRKTTPSASLDPSNANPPPQGPTSEVLPIVMIHGFLASGDTYASFALRFTSNDYLWKHINVFDWNTLAQSANDVVNLDKLVDAVLQKTGAAQVELIGHSAGGGLGYNYLKDATRAAKVAHYVHIGSSVQTGPAGPVAKPVPTLNLWSDGDKTVQGGDIPNATNVKIPNKDHYQLATSPESFTEIYTFFQGKKPTTTEISYTKHPCIGGRALSFGENQGAANASIKIYEVNPTTGERLSSVPDHDLTADAQGYWSIVPIEAKKPYEIVVLEAGVGKRAIHYYREGFIHNNGLVYLRTLPPPGSLAGVLLSNLPTNPEQSVLNVFSSSQAMISGRDSLLVDDKLLTTPQIAPASKTMIALFLFDNNKNKVSDFTVIGTFALLQQFLNGIDQFFDTKLNTPIVVRLNQRSLALHRWKASEDILVAVFD